MKSILVLLAIFLIAEAKSPFKKGKEDLFSYSSITAVYFPDEAATNSLCRALECQDGHLCVVYHDDRAVCMKEKAWKKLIAGKRADSQKKNRVGSTKKVVGFQNDCQPCPVVHPVFVCGSDNVTYSSDCRLQYKNCEDNTSIKLACEGRCPCPAADELVQEPAEKVSNKPDPRVRKATMWQKAREAGNNTKTENDIIITDEKSGKAMKTCAKKEMRELRRRLVAWFWTIFHQKFPEGSDPMALTDAPVCSRGSSPGILSWMFSYFDGDKDGSLTLSELFDLEADKYEHCINPFLAHCDADDDLEVSGHEWCRCLQKH